MTPVQIRDAFLPAAPPATLDESDAGAEGNSRLTAAVGLLLTVLLAVEGVTLLDVRQLITVHVAVGLVLIAPVAVKIATTSYRFLRYYTGARPYVRRGSPPIVLRLLGPALIVFTVALLTTGVALITRPVGAGGPWLFLHQASFAVWVAVMTVHFLGHILESVHLVVREVRHPSPPARARRGVRVAAVALTLAVGVGIAVVLVPGNGWTSGQLGAGEHHRQHDG